MVHDYPPKCDVVLYNDCEYHSFNTKCYACGQNVCRSCSVLRFDKATRRKTRACYSCVTDDPERWGFKDLAEAESFFDNRYLGVVKDA